MGKWETPPLDYETWNGQNTNVHFKKYFGLQKGILNIYDFKEGYSHVYAPKSYLKSLFAYIRANTAKDYKFLDRKLKAFYPLVQKSKLIVKKVKTNDLRDITNEELIKRYQTIRERVQRIAIFDQFGWLGEEYWTPVMEYVLVKKLSLLKGSSLYNKILFALTKPEMKSTTLTERQAVILEALKIKLNKSTVVRSSQQLAKKWGWLPVFNFGTAWGASYYNEELSNQVKIKQSVLLVQHSVLKNYTRTRNQEITNIVKHHAIKKKDLQIFVDFGLALDTRNEAEYFVSYCGFHLIPIYAEIARRFSLSIPELRKFTEQELIDTLKGITTTKAILSSRKKFFTSGYDEKMEKRINYSAQESERLFKFVQTHAKSLQGAEGSKGVCASPGKAIGKARIVPFPKDNYKVKTGDILITHATTVDYLPAMKKASAIITEVGGLTCHAAVVSREFGIPCIVALPNAMKMFKDGVLIEVNADNGTVKKV